jgi:membrane-bound serine protease (ClpP class)
MRKRATTGVEGMIGERGTARDAVDPLGSVTVHGEIWKARSESGSIAAGATVRVVDVDSLTLIVREDRVST